VVMRSGCGVGTFHGVSWGVLSPSFYSRLLETVPRPTRRLTCRDENIR